MSWNRIFENPVEPGRLQGREMELLSELSLEPIRRRVPGPGDSVVYDRSYNELLRRGLIKIHETQPGFRSLSDYYVLTSAGKEALRSQLVPSWARRSNPQIEPMQEGRKAALLAKPVRFQGRQMTKAQMVEEMVSRGGRLKVDHFPKYVFNRSAFNRMDWAEQRDYEKKMKTKMPFAVQLEDGTFFELTQTEAEYFKSLGGAT